MNASARQPQRRTFLSVAAARAGRTSLQFLLLAVALVSYGAIPSSRTATTEVESQLQEEATPGASGQLDLRMKLRGASLQRGEAVTLSAASLPAVARAAAASRSEQSGRRVSLGLALPLRC